MSGASNKAAQLRITGVAPDPGRPALATEVGYGQLWEGIFSNTMAIARARTLEDGGEIDTNPVEVVRAYQERWAAWADDVVAGRADASSFPV